MHPPTRADFKSVYNMKGQVLNDTRHHFTTDTRIVGGNKKSSYRTASWRTSANVLAEYIYRISLAHHKPCVTSLPVMTSKTIGKDVKSKKCLDGNVWVRILAVETVGQGFLPFGRRNTIKS